ncbi:Alpha/Beta hydrolase protein [Corynascus similis CBS 632.67]
MVSRRGSTAIKCSVAAYDPSARVPSDDTLAFTAIHSIPASTSGVIKATTFTRVTSAASCQQLPAEKSFSALVIAVRGSMKMIDWVVNANYEPCDAYDLLASAEWLPNERVHDTFRVHSGFLNGARALLPVVKEQLASTVGPGSDRASHVIFTGHSAGGAVASLLYLHFLGIASQTFPFLRFSLVTFGSPPVIAPSVTTLVNEHLKHQTNPGLAVAVVNETDVVARADNLYLSSLVDLYKSIDSLAPVAETTAQAQPRTRDGRYWQLPPPVYYLIGNIVVLKELDEDSDDPTITAFSVSESDFSRLLFCSSRAHHKEVYQRAVERLRRAEKVLVETTI